MSLKDIQANKAKTSKFIMYKTKNKKISDIKFFTTPTNFPKYSLYLKKLTILNQRKITPRIATQSCLTVFIVQFLQKIFYLDPLEITFGPS